MSGNEVKKILKNWGFSLKNVAELMGESPQNLNSMLNAQDIKTGVVDKIARAIKRPLYLFFQDKVGLMDDAEIAAQDEEVRRGKVSVYQYDPKDAIITAKDESIAAHKKTIASNEVTIGALQARIRDLEAQLHSSSTVLDNAPAVDIPSVGGCQTSPK